MYKHAAFMKVREVKNLQIMTLSSKICFPRAVVFTIVCDKIPFTELHYSFYLSCLNSLHPLKVFKMSVQPLHIANTAETAKKNLIFIK